MENNVRYMDEAGYMLKAVQAADKELEKMGGSVAEIKVTDIDLLSMIVRISFNKKALYEYGQSGN